MIRHLLRLSWHRKRANALVLLEIFACFLVVFAVTALAVHLGVDWRRPIGFEWRDRWTVNLELTSEQDSMAEVGPVLEQLAAEAESLPEVRSATLAGWAPYANSHWITEFEADGVVARTSVLLVDDDFARTMDLRLVAGRWFEPGDDARSWRPVVVNRLLARERFGDQDPVGRVLGVRDDGTETRVVGVVSEFRQGGELWTPRPYAFVRVRLHDPAGQVPQALLLRVAPELPAGFEAELTRRLQRIAPAITFDPRPLSRLRRDSHKLAFVPVVILGVLGGFLILMVVLGLTGVLWQTVTRRLREIGLRRAVGASAGAVWVQLLVETLILTTFAILAAVVLLAQVPLTEAFDAIQPDLYAVSMVVAAALMYLLVTACVLYPGWLATTVHPAEALHAE